MAKLKTRTALGDTQLVFLADGGSIPPASTMSMQKFENHFKLIIIYFMCQRDGGIDTPLTPLYVAKRAGMETCPYE